MQEQIFFLTFWSVSLIAAKINRIGTRYIFIVTVDTHLLQTKCKIQNLESHLIIDESNKNVLNLQ